MFDAIKPYTLTAFDVGTDQVVSIPTFMGIENSFGHLWEWTQGINFLKEEAAFKAYIYDNGAYEDIIGVKHSRYFEFIKTQGWVKNMKLGAHFDLIASQIESGASSSTYMCDNFYNDPALGLRGLLRSGGACDGSVAGLVYAYSFNSVTNANTYVGSRLCFYGRVRPGV